jgi:hypothetical protein
MKKSFFSLFAIIAAGLIIAPSNLGKHYQRKLPILISYKEITPPDSLQDFIKIYLRIQKWSITNSKELMEKMKENIMQDMAKTFGSENGKLKDPVSEPLTNVFGVKIFKREADTTNYFIDSIQWFVGQIPTKDTSFVRKMYFPQSNNVNPYITLKDFLDTVLASGSLK